MNAISYESIGSDRMNTQWFLGANTADGFVSRFEALQTDPRVKKLIILKGGPGCGKSTFMKKLRKTAQSLGADTESYPCSSDPASLDGLLILPLGLAIVDGTAPHVLEPRLCGCDAVYLNLGCFYDADKIPDERQRLEALRAKNQALYPAAYAHLRAARELKGCAKASAIEIDHKSLYALTRGLMQELPPSLTGESRVREVFLHAFTPEGEIRLMDTVHSLCNTCVAVEDPCGLSGTLFERLKDHYLHAGYDCMILRSPLFADTIEGILLPEIGTAYLACVKAPKDASITVNISRYYRFPDSAAALPEAAERHCAQAVALLREAKALHDEIEAVYRPYVSFEGLDLLTQEYQKQIKGELLLKNK